VARTLDEVAGAGNACLGERIVREERLRRRDEGVLRAVIVQERRLVAVDVGYRVRRGGRVRIVEERLAGACSENV